MINNMCGIQKLFRVAARYVTATFAAAKRLLLGILDFSSAFFIAALLYVQPLGFAPASGATPVSHESHTHRGHEHLPEENRPVARRRNVMVQRLTQKPIYT